MHFLLDANMPRNAMEIIAAAGHTATHLRDTPSRHASDNEVASIARSNGWALVTRDFDFADIRRYPPAGFQGIVVLQLPDTATAATIGALVGSFLAHAEVVARLPRRLAIVEFGRVRLREE